MVPNCSLLSIKWAVVRKSVLFFLSDFFILLVSCWHVWQVSPPDPGEPEHCDSWGLGRGLPGGASSRRWGEGLRRPGLWGEVDAGLREELCAQRGAGVESCSFRSLLTRGWLLPVSLMPWAGQPGGQKEQVARRGEPWVCVSPGRRPTWRSRASQAQAGALTGLWRGWCEDDGRTGYVARRPERLEQRKCQSTSAVLTAVDSE